MVSGDSVLKPSDEADRAQLMYHTYISDSPMFCVLCAAAVTSDESRTDERSFLQSSSPS